MLYDSESMRRFAWFDLLHDTVPDETTICKFRHLLEAHQLTARMFGAVKALLEERKLLLKAGTIVDATIIGAPSPTKNATKTRDPEMQQTKKGNQWYFGMKVHVGTDGRGVIHTITTTDAPPRTSRSCRTCRTAKKRRSTATRRTTKPTTSCSGSSAAAGTRSI